MPSLSLFRIQLLAMALMLAAGCQLSKPPPLKHHYWLDLNPRSSVPQDRGQYSVRVSPIRVAAPFDQKSFVYRRDSVRFDVDFYHEFISQPGPMFTEQVRLGLEQTALFSTVLPPSSPSEADYLVEGLVTDIVGDYREIQHPKAVLAMHFWFHDNRAVNRPLIHQQQYRIEISIPNQLAESLARGWSQALGRILAQLESDLKQAIGTRTAIIPGVPNSRSIGQP